MIKANRLAAIPQAVQPTVPVGPDHPFFINFDGLRGDYDDMVIYRSLNVEYDGQKLTFDPIINQHNKTILFLSGMRGSGKTSELQKYTKKLHNPDCFFVVTCNIDNDLDIDNVEYMDILIYQLEKLLKRLEEKKINLGDRALNSLKTWSEERIKEINTSLKGQMELKVGAKTNNVFSYITGMFTELRVGVSGSVERADKVRSVLKNRFGDFANKFNEFIEEANKAIRSGQNGQEVLFIIDGLEKTFSAKVRERIFTDESNRISQIKAYTIFTLPIELFKYRKQLSQFGTVKSFPFIKIKDKAGNIIPNTMERYMEFVEKRVSIDLFESKELIKEMIVLSGGSPRQLLQIIDQTNNYSDFDKTILEKATFEKTIRILSSEMSQHLRTKQLELLKELNTLKEDEQLPFDDEIMQPLLEDLIIMEYDDGSNRRVNPLVTMSKIYKQYVK